MNITIDQIIESITWFFEDLNYLGINENELKNKDLKKNMRHNNHNNLIAK